MVEFLIAYLPVLLAFLMFWQLGELLVAQMVVERASSAAGRAAIVVIPDDPAFYDAEPNGSFSGQRKREIRLAAGMMLAASPHISENFTVEVTNVPTGDDQVAQLTVAVAAEFRCKRLTWVCGADGYTLLGSSSVHTYHGANYQYEPTDLTLLGTGTGSGASTPGCTANGTPGAGGKGGGSGGAGSGKGGSGAGGKGSGGTGSGGVPGKGNGGRGGSGGTGGNDPDPSGSCPPGQTLQADNTCANSRGGIHDCGPDATFEKATGRCLCIRTKQPVDALGNCPGGSGGSGGAGSGGGGNGGNGGNAGATCRYGTNQTTVEPKLDSANVCPGAKNYLIGKADNTGECCQKTAKRDSNGCIKYDCGCAPQTKAKQPHSQINATFITHDFGQIAQLTTGTGKFPACTDTCSSSNTKDLSGTAESVQDQFIAKQFNTMCGGSPFLKGDIMKKVRYDKKQINPKTGKPPLRVVVYDQLTSQAGKDLWQALDDYCTEVQAHITANGTVTPIGSHLAEDAQLQGIEGRLAGQYDKVQGNAGDYAIVGNQLSGGNANHTETKVIQLLKHWALESAADQPRELLEHGTLMLQGEASPCANCAKDLSAFAGQYHIAIQYTFDHIYKDGPTHGDPSKPQYLDPPGGNYVGTSIEFHGSVEYDENGTATYHRDAGQKKLCGN